jgi:multiple sugar transport system substrate-binding protein
MDALIVNKTLFAEAGQPPPPAGYEDPAWTYDRALELAKGVARRRPDGGAERLGIDVGGYRYEGHVENAGGAWFSADGKSFAGHLPPSVAAIDWLAGLKLKHNVAATPATDEARSLNFASGRLGMSWSGVSQVSNRLQDVGDRFDWDVAPVPRWGANKLVVKSGFSALVLNARSKQPDAAWQFLQWITGPVGSLPDVETGWSVPVFSGLDERYFARVGQKKNLTVALDGPKHPSSYPIWTNPNYAEAWRRVQTAIDLIFQGKGTAGDLLSQARPEVDAILVKTN